MSDKLCLFSSEGRESTLDEIFTQKSLCLWLIKASKCDYNIVFGSFQGFFRRTVQKNPTYKCHKNGNCDTTMQKRTRCQHCRFQRCLAAGMSREGKLQTMEKTVWVKSLSVSSHVRGLISFSCSRSEREKRQSHECRTHIQSSCCRPTKNFAPRRSNRLCVQQHFNCKIRNKSFGKRFFSVDLFSFK